MILSPLNTTCCVMCLSLSWTFHIQFGGIFYVYQIYFRVANFLDVSSALLDESGPGRSKSTYETILSLIRSFKRWRCNDNPFILLQNNKDLKYLPTTLTSFYMSFDFSSFNLATSYASLFMYLVASFSSTSLGIFLFFAYCFCFYCILFSLACVGYENGVSL